MTQIQEGPEEVKKGVAFTYLFYFYWENRIWVTANKKSEWDWDLRQKNGWEIGFIPPLLHPTSGPSFNLFLPYNALEATIIFSNTS